jgi:hypothetical protein
LWASAGLILILSIEKYKFLLEPSIGASYQISVHFSTRFQKRFFRNRPIRNKNCLWWPCLLTDLDEMSILYRGPNHLQSALRVAPRCLWASAGLILILSIEKYKFLFLIGRHDLH